MTTKEFIEKMAKDEALAKKLEGCKSPEEAYEVANEAGLTDDIESFKAIMTAVNKQIKGELSDDELSDIAGGISENTKNILIGEAIVAGATVVSFAAGSAA